MLGPPKNERARSLAARTQSSIFRSRDDSSKPSCKQYLAKGTADELRRIAAAFDAINDPNADVETARAAVATLEEFRRKDQFEWQPSKSDFTRVAAAAGFTSEQITAAWASYLRDGKFTAIFAMSWQALKWAAQQQAGDLSANAVLRVYADHATATGRTFVDSKTIAKELQTSQPTVLNATARILKRGLMRDTKERTGQTGHVRVFQLKIPRENKRTSSFSASRGKSANKRTNNAKATHKQRTSNAQAALALHDTRARVSSNLEPGTNETVVRSSQNELLVSNNKDDKKNRQNFRPLSRPKDADEVWEYIYNANNDHPKEETAPLAKYFRDLAGADEDDAEGERDIEYWLHMNERNGWRGVTDWRVHLNETFLRGWFPSQKRKAKRRLAR